MARLRIDQCGPLTSVQDRGRPGHARFGVTASGPVDRFAYAAAQAALGQSGDASALELSLGGITLTALDEPIGFALMGGDFQAERDGMPLGSWVRDTLLPGQSLRVREGTSGNWGYLAFKGRLGVEFWLGSTSTHVMAGLGGGVLRAGAILDVIEPGIQERGGFAPANDRLDQGVHIIMGPQQHYFSEEILATLIAVPFQASGRFDRMGMVLDGPALQPSRLDMPSEAAVRGALQVDGAGRLTALLADHQTTGGYPKIAVIADVDCDRVAQMRAGQAVHFKAITPEEAVAMLRLQRAAEMDWLRSLAQPRSMEAQLGSANLIDGIFDASAMIGE